MVKVPEYNREVDLTQVSTLNAPFQAVGSMESVANKKLAPEQLRNSEYLRNAQEISQNMKRMGDGLLQYANKIEVGKTNQALNALREDLIAKEDKYKRDYQGFKSEEIAPLFKKDFDDLVVKHGITSREGKIQAENIKISYLNNLTSYVRGEVEKAQKVEYEKKIDNYMKDIQKNAASDDLYLKFQNIIVDEVVKKAELEGFDKEKNPDVFEQLKRDVISSTATHRVNHFLSVQNPRAARQALEKEKNEINTDIYSALNQNVTKMETDFRANDIANEYFDLLYSGKIDEQQAFDGIYNDTKGNPYLKDKARQSLENNIKIRNGRDEKFKNNLDINPQMVTLLNVLERNTDLNDAQAYDLIDGSVHASQFGRDKIKADAVTNGILQYRKLKKDGKLPDKIDPTLSTLISQCLHTNNGNCEMLWTNRHQIPDGDFQHFMDIAKDIQDKIKTSKGGSENKNHNSDITNDVIHTILKQDGAIDKDGKATSSYVDKYPQIKDLVEYAVKEQIEKKGVARLSKEQLLIEYFNLTEAYGLSKNIASKTGLKLDLFSKYFVGVPYGDLDPRVQSEINMGLAGVQAAYPSFNTMPDSPEKYQLFQDYMSQYHSSSEWSSALMGNTGMFDKAFREAEAVERKNIPIGFKIEGPDIYDPSSSGFIKKPKSIDRVRREDVESTLNLYYPDLAGVIGKEHIGVIKDMVNRAEVKIAAEKFTDSVKEEINIIDDFLLDINFDRDIKMYAGWYSGSQNIEKISDNSDSINNAVNDVSEKIGGGSVSDFIFTDTGDANINRTAITLDVGNLLNLGKLYFGRPDDPNPEANYNALIQNPQNIEEIIRSVRDLKNNKDFNIITGVVGKPIYNTTSGGYLTKYSTIKKNEQGKEQVFKNAGRLFDGEIPKFKVTSEYGEKRGQDIHGGIDFAAPIGTPLKSIHSGTVTKVGYDNRSGNYVVITNEETGYQTLYAHLDSINVTQGEVLDISSDSDKRIGFTGNTGRSTGPHLHLEIRKKNDDGKYEKVNPIDYINDIETYEEQVTWCIQDKATGKNACYLGIDIDPKIDMMYNSSFGSTYIAPGQEIGRFNDTNYFNYFIR